MPVVMDSAKMTATTISNMVFAAYKTVSICFVVHHDEQLTEAMGLAAQEILWHPAAENALHILNASHGGKAAELCGITYAHNSKNLFSGHARRYLAICTINLGKHNTMEHFKQTAWHLVWHVIARIEAFEDDGAIDASSGNTPLGFLRRLSGNKPRHTGTTGRNIIGKSRDIMTIVRANLAADIFSCLMSGYDGDVRALDEIAMKRIGNVLKKQQNASPEYYPFPIAIDGTKTALEMFVSKSWPKKQIIPRAVRATKNLALVYDDESVKHWIVFAGHAQDMVWRGIGTADILGAAMHMGGTTHTRMLAHRMSELLGVTTTSPTGNMPFFNSFMPADMAKNVQYHITSDLFAKYLAMALQDKKGRVLNEVADKQNAALADGEINGWCALALQYAARAVDVAISSGHDPGEMAQKEFESCRAKVTLEHLRKLSRLIIQEKRQGTTITMEKVRSLCAANEDLRLIGQSIKNTVTGQEPLAEKRMA